MILVFQMKTFTRILYMYHFEQVILSNWRNNTRRRSAISRKLKKWTKLDYNKAWKPSSPLAVTDKPEARIIRDSFRFNIWQFLFTVFTFYYSVLIHLFLHNYVLFFTYISSFIFPYQLIRMVTWYIKISLYIT